MNCVLILLLSNPQLLATFLRCVIYCIDGQAVCVCHALSDGVHLISIIYNCDLIITELFTSIEFDDSVQAEKPNYRWKHYRKYI